MLNCGTVYGRDSNRAKLLRKFENGKLRTSISDKGEEVPLMWKDVDLNRVDLNISSIERKSTSAFVAGEDVLNLHWGHLFWLQILTLRHNDLCDELLARNPNLTDEEVFQKAKIIQFVTNVRMIVEDYISGFFGNSIFQGKAIWKFNPEECTADGVFRSSLTSPTYMEFNHLYRWHSLVPSVLEYPNKTIDFSNDIVDRSNSYNNYSLQSHFESFYNSASGTFAPNNELPLFRFVTAKTIQDERNHGMGTFNDYLELHGYARLSSFNQLLSNPETIAKLESLYESVDDLDFYVGIMLQEAGDHSLGPDLMLAMVAEHAFSFIYGFASPCSLSESYLSEDFLTPWGKEYILDSSISPMFRTLNGRLDLTAFHNKKSFLSRSNQSYTTSLRNMCEGEYDVRNLLDYNGMNELWHPAMTEDEFQIMLLVIMAILASAVLLFAIPLRYLSLHMLQEKREIFDPIISFNFVFGLIYLLFLPFYTYIFTHILFSCRFDLTISGLLIYITLMWGMHGVLYVCDMVIRSHTNNFNLMLVFHHVAFFVTTSLSLGARDIFSVKLNIILDYFSSFEFGLFILLAYSKYNKRKLTPMARYFGIFSVLIYDITRFIQTGFLLYLFIGSYQAMADNNLLYIYAIQIILSIILTIAQTYTIYEYSKWTTLWNPTSSDARENDSIKKESFMIIGSNSQDTIPKSMDVLDFEKNGTTATIQKQAVNDDRSDVNIDKNDISSTYNLDESPSTDLTLTMNPNTIRTT